jgi:hypothetical protein
VPDTVRVTLEVDPETATALQDPATRARLERLIRSTVRPTSVAQLSAETRGRGLTNEILEVELAAYTQSCATTCSRFWTPPACSFRPQKA